MEQLLPYLVGLLALLPAILALAQLGRTPEVNRLLWTLVIVFFPLVGPLAFFLIVEGATNRSRAY